MRDEVSLVGESRVWSTHQIGQHAFRSRGRGGMMYGAATYEVRVHWFWRAVSRCFKCTRDCMPSGSPGKLLLCAMVKFDDEELNRLVAGAVRVALVGDSEEGDIASGRHPNDG